jgi:hypothetical protein
LPEAGAGQKPGKISIFIDNLEIAKVHFVLTVGDAAAAPGIVNASTSAHRTAFASYASADRDTVLHIIQGMQKVAPDLDVFLDVASLRSGDRWAHRLVDEIGGRDVFYLFWSESASRSEWVEREWRCALERKGIDFINPVPLVSPAAIPPPKELGELHFNDWVLAYRRHTGAAS